MTSWERMTEPSGNGGALAAAAEQAASKTDAQEHRAAGFWSEGGRGGVESDCAGTVQRESADILPGIPGRAGSQGTGSAAVAGLHAEQIECRGSCRTDAALNRRIEIAKAAAHGVASPGTSGDRRHVGLPAI